MMPHAGSALHALQIGMLRAASFLTPSARRLDWFCEWRAELWHVRRERVPTGAFSWPAECEVAAFCLGAFRDAFCLRRERPRRAAMSASFNGSALQCLLVLAVAPALGMIFARLSPGVRTVGATQHSRVSGDLVLIRQAGPDGEASPSVLFGTLSRWKARRQSSFDAFAFYSIGSEPVITGAPSPTRWSVAYASTNLFTLADIPLQFALPDPPAGAPALVLGCATFVRDFGADPQIVGSVVRIDHRETRIAAVLPCGALAFPGRVDAWLLEPDSAIAPDARGYVVAHLSERGRQEMTAPRTAITTSGSGDGEVQFWADAIEERERGPWAIYLFTVLLALLALPAVASVSMAESTFSSHKPAPLTRICRWGFLGAKIALLLAGAWFISLDLAYSCNEIDSQLPQNIQLVSSFSICLFGLRWIVLDQRQRCPVCLRRVTNPARVGDASRTFLGWNGTELMCAAGHTLLHVPGLPTSWFGARRWLYLDTSWEFLFAAPGEM